MDPYARDLERWIPRLIAVWRRAQKRPPGPPELQPQEVKQLGAAVQKLSLGLTRDRTLAGANYLDDPKLLGAYLLFYWPVSYAQARQVLGELPHRPRLTLDLGSGPGPLAFAALDAGAAQVTAADRSKPALALARELAAEAEEALATRDWDPTRSQLPAGDFDFITMGHVLNELFGQGDAALLKRAALVESALARLKKRGTLLIIEPALRDTSRDLLKLRDLLLPKGYAVRAPCLFRGDCPALIKPTDWCHAERIWTLPRAVEQIAHEAGLHKESLKMSYLALAAKDESWPELPKARLFRVVSESLVGKGRQRYIGCGPEGRIGLAIQTKHRGTANEPFFHLKRGDVISVTQTELKGDGLNLGAETEVQVVSPAGKPLPEPWES